MVVGPPAIRGHDPLVARKEPFGVLLVPAGGDGKDGVAVGEHAPQRALAAFQSPARLVHVQALTSAHTPEEILIWFLQRVRGAGQDRLDRASANTRAEELFAELHDISAADAVTHRQRRHGRLQARPERGASNRAR